MSSKDYNFNAPLTGDDAKVVSRLGLLIGLAGFLLAWFTFTYTFNAFIAQLFHIRQITPAWSLGIIMFLNLIMPTVMDFSGTVTVNKNFIKPLVGIVVSLIVLVTSWVIVFFNLV